VRRSEGDVLYTGEDSRLVTKLMTKTFDR
jgi:hypothetical protein